MPALKLSHILIVIGVFLVELISNVQADAY